MLDEFVVALENVSVRVKNAKTVMVHRSSLASESSQACFTLEKECDEFLPRSR
jgi:hypothetical protein